MIPADVASRQQVTAEAALRPVAPSQEISDKLSGLVAGQKIMAEIQALLPNGTYRALINQRNITLALPFSAKAGDSLEFEVTESNGKLALAVLARQEANAGNLPASTSTTLSRTAQLISTLFSGVGEGKDRAQPVVLNGNQPIAGAPPTNAQDLLPLLKQAIARSGLFYESHQAEWIAGRLPKASLLQEPQGRLSSPAAFLPDPEAPAGEQLRTLALRAQINASDAPSAARVAVDSGQPQTSQSDSGKTTVPQTSTALIAPQTQPLVHQQLQALATHNFAWQGQIWPGQEMQWEIEENASGNTPDGDEDGNRWSTRLRLSLPNLGEIDPRIRLQDNRIELSMTAASAETHNRMREASLNLRRHFEEAGLLLSTMGIDTMTEQTTNESEQS